MLIDQTQASALITARAPGSRLHQDFHAASRRDPEKSEPQQPAKLQDPGVALATSSPGAHGKPNLVARRCPIDPLQQKLEVESKLQLADNHKRRLLAAQGDEIAPADFTLHTKAEIFEKALHGRVERRLPR